MEIKLDNVSYELEMADKKSKMLGDDNRGICYYELASILIKLLVTSVIIVEE